MRQVTVTVKVNQSWIDSMAPATAWLDFLASRINGGIDHRGSVLDLYEESRTPRRVVVIIEVSEAWIESMAPGTEWMGFLAARISRGLGNRGQVVALYEVT